MPNSPMTALTYSEDSQNLTIDTQDGVVIIIVTKQNIKVCRATVIKQLFSLSTAKEASSCNILVLLPPYTGEFIQVSGLPLCPAS